ncbi:MAG: hypothetical protein R6W70_04070 [bacterium]
MIYVIIAIAILFTGFTGFISGVATANSEAVSWVGLLLSHWWAFLLGLLLLFYHRGIKSLFRGITRMFLRVFGHDKSQKKEE